MPLTDKEISSKFHSLADPILGASRADEIEALSNYFFFFSIYKGLLSSVGFVHGFCQHVLAP